MAYFPFQNPQIHADQMHSCRDGASPENRQGPLLKKFNGQEPISQKKTKNLIIKNCFYFRNFFFFFGSFGWTLPLPVLPSSVLACMHLFLKQFYFILFLFSVQIYMQIKREKKKTKALFLIIIFM
jgi:hypothetical protein